MHPAKFALSQLIAGPPETFQGLSMFPLQSPVNGTVDYLLLGEALHAGLVTVREISESGSVPDLVVENRANRPVLIVDGEEFIGAKQNRVANLTLLIPAAKTTTIPVSCVEQGRWSFQSDEFALSERVHYARGRAAKLASVQASMRSTGTRHSDQSAVWDSIEEKAVAVDAQSPTGAMGSIFERHAQTLDKLVAHFQADSDQSGGIFAVGGTVCGLDAFDKPTTFAALLPKLIRSYGIDAFEQGQLTETASNVEAAGHFLAGIGKGELDEHEAAGLGHDIRITTAGIIAGGLVVDSSLVHVAAFTEPHARQTNTGLPDDFASYRQRRHSFRRRHQ